VLESSCVSGLPSNVSDAKKLVYRLVDSEWFPEKELGADCFGTVFQTFDPEVVVKFTGDWQELDLVKRFRRMRKNPPPGIVEIYKYKVLLPYKPLVVIWKEYAKMPRVPAKLSDLMEEYCNGMPISSTNGMSKYKQYRPLAKTLRYFWDRGIHFTDLRAGNVGLVKRRGNWVWSVVDFGAWEPV
jgi:hypothetical protein